MTVVNERWPVPSGSHDEPSGRARGGHARAAKLSPERRREIARNANEARRDAERT